MMKRVKMLLLTVLALWTIFGFSTVAYAKPRLSVLQNSSGWINLSDQDKIDTITALVHRVCEDLNIQRIPDVSTFRWPESNIAAYNTMITYTICVNLSVYDTDYDASLVGETVEYHLVKAVAHEVRHTYQQEHMYDDTEYGRNVFASQTNYIEHDTNAAAYFKQFVEQDAESYGVAFADKFVKNGKIKTAKLVAVNGKQFDATFYANTYPDVKQALGTDPNVLLYHYNTFGISEGRKANANDIVN